MSNDLENMMSTELAQIQDMDAPQLIARVLELRQELSDKRNEWQTYEAETKRTIELCETRLMQIADSVGTTTLKSDLGTAFKQTKKTYQVGEWDLIVQYIKDTGNFHILEKRIGKLATAEIHSATGEIPPGVNYFEEEEMVVRKAPSKRKDS